MSPERCPDVAGIGVRMRPKFAIFNKDENNLKIFISEKAFKDKTLKLQEKIDVSIVDIKLELEIEDLHKPESVIY